MDALADSVELIRVRLNAALQAAEQRADDWVILSSAQPAAAVRDTISMMLVHISSDAAVRAAADRVAPPTARLDLLVAFVANFQNAHYAQGLTAISRVMSFFQQTPVFTPSGPGTHTGPLTMQLADLNVADAGTVMQMLGITYRPSVFYRLRGVSVG